jgi:hypothetical protein
MCMRARFLLLVVAVVIGALGCAPAQQPQLSAETALDELWVVFDAIEPPEDRVPMLEDFIVEYPDTSQSVNALRDVVYYRSEKMGDLAGAISSTRNTLGQTTDPEFRFEIGLLLHDLTYQAGEATDLAAVANEFADHRTLGFVDLLHVVEAGEKSGSWEVVLDSATAMDAFANEDAFRAAYPDDDFSDERVESSVNRRRAWVVAYQGGALTELGRLDEAETRFLAAESIPSTTDFVGVPETPIDIYRGQAALLRGRAELAADLFAHDALMGGDERALEGLSEAYAAMNGGADGYEAYLEITRERIARPLPDIGLVDYAGTRFDLSSTLGKVMVLSFWNPG